MSEPEIVFEVLSQYGQLTKKPFVRITSRQLNFSCQVEPEAARRLAVNLLAAAEASEIDAFLIEYLQERLKLASPQITTALIDFRRWRERRVKK